MSGELTVGPSQLPPEHPEGNQLIMGPTPPPSPPPAAESGGGMDWRRMAAALGRYKWLVLLLLAVGAGGGFFAARSAKSIYSAQATVWIATPSERGADRGPIRQEQLLEMSGWVELLNSFVVLDHAVERVKLYLQVRDPADGPIFATFRLSDAFAPGAYRLTVNEGGTGLTLTTAVGTVIERASPGDSLGQKLGFIWAPAPTTLVPGAVVEFSVVTPRDAARALSQQLLITPALEGNFVRVELEGTNAELITGTVNALVERYEEVAAQLKREKLTELASILREQLDQSETNLRRAELALESFRVQTITLPSERATPVAPGLAFTQDPVMRNYFELKVSRDQLIRDRDAIARAMSEGAIDGLSPDALGVVGEVQRSKGVTQALGELLDRQAELRALRYRYTDEHPTVARVAEQVRDLETNTIPTLVAGLLADIDARQLEMDSMIQSASRELQQIPPRAIQEARLTRDKEVAEQLYTQLQQRYEEARLAEASSIPDLRILDPAIVPQRPVRYRGQLYLLIGVLGGLSAGVFGAILLDRVDRRVRYPDHVTDQLGLSLLGVVPRLKGSGNGAESNEAAAVIEALRGVRLNLVHARGSSGPLALTVSSPGAGDGKSFISSNLALAFAEAGHRTLLIDGDARRGTLHRAVGASRKPGITDFLAGQATLRQVVQETEYKSLSFIGCGTRTSEAPELLSSPAMSEFMANLRNSYGVIVVDSPPLSAGVDPFALGTLTGNMVVVLRLGATNREMAEAKLEVLDRLPVRVLGAVLNDVRGGSVYGYYRYYSYHLPGYEHEDEEDREDRQVLGEVS